MSSVNDWILKAEHDFEAVSILRKSIYPLWDIICFHTQQCTEKYLKAFLIFHGMEIDKTHNIREIVNQCMHVDSSFQELLEIRISYLSRFAVEIRYPEEGSFPNQNETDAAIEICSKARIFLRSKLNLEN